MNPTVLAALIGAAGALIVCLVNNHYQDKKHRDDMHAKEMLKAAEEVKEKAEMKAWMNGIEKEIKELIRKIDIHNGYADKIGSMQTDIAYIKGKMEEQKA